MPMSRKAAHDVLMEAVEVFSHQFDGDPDTELNVSGADLVDWFSQWRLRAREALNTEEEFEARALHHSTHP